MSNRVIEFHKKGCATAEPEVWQCYGCDGTVFTLYGDGSIRCPTCDTEQTPRHFDPQEKP